MSNITWVEYTALGVSIFMALIAIASTIITTYVFKASSDPDIIVYPEQDKDSKTQINLIIKNIGNGAAKNIRFQIISDRGLPRNAYGLESPLMPDKMSDGPLISGIPFLSPGAERKISWGQYPGLYQWFGNSSIDVKSKFERNNKMPFIISKIESTSSLDILSFATIVASDNSSIKKLTSEISQMRKQLENTNKALRSISASES